MSPQGIGVADDSFHTVGVLLDQAEADLKNAGIEEPTLEASWLLECVLELSPLMQRVGRQRPVPAAEWARAQLLIQRRVNREPLQYLLGTQEFCGREFRVTPAVLIPRPESALLVDETVRRCKGNQSGTVVDVGTGSGCLVISVAAALTTARVLAIDISSEALAVARINMTQHGVAERIECFCGDLLAPLRGPLLEHQVDVILSNPPYIAESEWMILQPEVRCFEPRLALAGGRDGMDICRRLLRQAPSYLKPGGALLMEVGAGQAASVCRQAEETGWFRVYDVLRDEGHIDRVVCCERTATGAGL